ncbi:MAG TPA: molybdenum cofactor biosynthesis protein MoaE [Actinomycetota bacterium]|nr:molybdenum cofactor biosynthesis protein MoaE [Actinomycetota bacterium]
MSETRAALSSNELKVADIMSEATDPACGAVAAFIGTVRETASVDKHRDASVVALEYDAHPSLAEEKMEEIVRAAAEKWGLERVVAVHRTGRCELGEPTVVVACGAGHRAEALEACHWIIDEIKATVPIWKKEIYSDGSSWVGDESS